MVADRSSVRGTAIRPRDFEMVAGGQRIGRHNYDCDRTPIMN
jgi:hypothetical protein